MDEPCDLCPERAGIYTENNGKFCRVHYDELRAWERAVLDQATANIGGPFPQLCPRRSEVPSNKLNPDQDCWEFGHGLTGGNAERLLTCSYCGSVHPDAFMEKVREGWVVGPTDKSYKAYLGKPAEPYPEGHDMYGYPHDHDVAKFYYQHLSAEQREEFIALYNDKRMVVGYPGHFYSTPYFCRKGT